MYRGFLALFLAFTILPMAAAAQESPAPPNPPPAAAGMRSAVRSLAHQTRQLHDQFRTEVLSALTAEHRDFVAKAIGQLAIAPSPDPQAVSQQIDAVLSPGEKQQILSAQTTLTTQSKALRQKMMEQLRSLMQKMQGSPHPEAHPMGRMGRHAQQPPTAGMVVLHALFFEAGGRALMSPNPKGPPPQP